MKIFRVILNLSSVTQSDYPWAPYYLKFLLQPFTQVIEKRVAMTWVSHQMPDPSFREDLHVSSKRTELEGIVISRFDQVLVVPDACKKVSDVTFRMLGG